MLNNIAEKKKYFNEYWQTRDIKSADARSVQRAKFVRSLLSEERGEKIIDVGCGRGVILADLISNGYSASGCDISSETVTELVQNGYEAFLCDLETEPLPGKYDVVLWLEVLQQVFDPIKVIGNFSGALYKNGYMIISVPNEFHIVSRLKMLFGKSHLGHFEESHIRLFTPKRARQMFEKSEMKIDKSISVSIVPPGIKFLQPLGKLLAWLMPSLFSLSQIYKVKNDERYNSDKI